MIRVPLDLDPKIDLTKPIYKQSVKDIQIGGTHYKDMPIQPGEYIVKNGIGWYEGNVIKYVTRHKAKGQKQDLLKAIHYLQLAIEEHYGQDST